jgi:peroxiredoxin
MRFAPIILAAAAACSMSAPATNVGDTAPLFSLSTYGGGTFDLAQQKGKVTALYFFGAM